MRVDGRVDDIVMLAAVAQSDVVELIMDGGEHLSVAHCESSPFDYLAGMCCEAPASDMGAVSLIGTFVRAAPFVDALVFGVQSRSLGERMGKDAMRNI